MDINLGDLRYKIPAGATRDLLSPTARLDPALVQKSRTEGSIAARLGKTLIEVQKKILLTVPLKEESRKAIGMLRPRDKSSVLINAKKEDDKLNNIIMQEEEDLLKEMAEEDLMMEVGEVPLVSKKKKEEE